MFRCCLSRLLRELENKSLSRAQPWHNRRAKTQVLLVIRSRLGWGPVYTKGGLKGGTVRLTQTAEQGHPHDCTIPFLTPPPAPSSQFSFILASCSAEVISFASGVMLRKRSSANNMRVYQFHQL